MDLEKSFFLDLPNARFTVGGLEDYSSWLGCAQAMVMISEDTHISGCPGDNKRNSLAIISRRLG